MTISERLKSKSVCEIIRYGISGALISAVNYFTYSILLSSGVEYTISNIISIVLAKTVGYILNKYFVFKSRSTTFSESVREFLRYIITRGFTGLIDFFGLIVLVEHMNLDKKLSKLIILLIVIICNYILGKFIVFKTKHTEPAYSDDQ